MGDVHGDLNSFKNAVEWSIARNHFIIQLGDILDYGPYNLGCVDLLYDRIVRGAAISVVGNHERKIERWLDESKKFKSNPETFNNKQKIKLSDGNLVTVNQIESLTLEERQKFEAKFRTILGTARYHWNVQNTMFVHGACEPEMFTINSHRVMGKFETYAIYGEVDTSIPKNANGYPNRIYSWVDRIPFGYTVFVGHDIRSTDRPMIVNGLNGGQVIFMDTGCGKSGKLTTADITFTNKGLKIQNFNCH